MRPFLRICNLAACLLGACSAQESSRLRLVAQTGFAPGFAVAVSPDGRFALTGESSVARIWHLETGRELRRLVGSGQLIAAVCFSSDGKTAFTAGDGGTIRAWDVDTGREKWRKDTGSTKLNAAAMSEDGRYAVVAVEGVVQLWDLAAARMVSQFSKPFPDLYAVAISNSMNIAVAAGSSVVVTGGKKGFVHPAKVIAIAISPDDRLIATAADDNVLRIWNIESGAVLHELRGHTFGPFGMAFSPNGRWLFSGSDRDRVWDVQTGQLIREEEGVSGLGRFAFTADGRTVISGGVETAVRDVDTGRLRALIQGKTLVLQDGGFLPDGRILLANSFLYGQQTVVLSAQSGLKTGGSIGAEYCPFVTLYPQLGVTLTCSNEYFGKRKGRARLLNSQDSRLLAEFGPYDATIQAARLTGDGRTLALLAFDGTLALWDVETRQEKFRIATLPAAFATLDLSNDGRYALVSDSYGKHVLVDTASRLTQSTSDTRVLVLTPDGRLLKVAYDGVLTAQDIGSDKETRVMELGLSAVNTLILSPDGRRAFAGTRSGAGMLIDLAAAKIEWPLTGHWSTITRAAFSPDGRRLLTLSYDGQVRIWDTASGKSLMTVVILADGNWAVLDDEGRYDASNPKGLSGVHWVLKNEPIELGQLKNRFWTPGLLSRIFNGERLPEVPEAFHHLDLYPAVKVDPPARGSSSLKIQLANQGGGLGRVVVKVNGRELPLDVRGGSDPTAPAASLSVDLSQTVLSPDGDNHIEVAAYDAQGLVVSRGVTVTWKTEARPVKRQDFYAVVAGTSSYSGSPAMNLRYPAKDAADMARALELGANELFGRDHTHIHLLTSEEDASHLPTKANFRRAFAEIAAAATPGDTVLLYLAGHGVAKGKDTYYYLTADARSLELEDAALVDISTVSSTELQKWLQSDIKALKRLVILDTCAAGAANAEFIKLVEKRELTGDQIRAIELLNDSVGSHILMGSAADKVSYEASRYGQGLLTYALLSGMKGEVQLEGNQLDVLRWFTYAQGKVEILAKGIGGIQQPLLSSPIGRTFPVALLPNEVKNRIPLAAAKPQVLRAQCLSSTLSDPLGLGPLLRERLRDLSDPVTRGREGRTQAPLVYLDAVPDGLPGAISPRASYRRSGDGAIEVTLALIRDGDEKELAVRTLTGDERDKRGLAARIADSVLEALSDVQKGQ